MRFPELAKMLRELDRQSGQMKDVDTVDGLVPGEMDKLYMEG